MQLTAYISSAADGYFLVRTKEVPDLVVRVSIISDLSQRRVDHPAASDVPATMNPWERTSATPPACAEG